MLLRSGGAKCTASAAPGLVNTTSGAAVSVGAQLQINHMYLMTDDRAVTTAGGAVLLVRGAYTVL